MWHLPLIGLVKIIGGILIIFPQKIALVAVVIFPVMVGIVLTNVFADTSGLPIAIVLAAILGWINCDNRDAYEPL